MMDSIADIQVTRVGDYQVHIPLGYMESWLKEADEDYGLYLEPPFQRGHVWTTAQREAYLKFFFSNATTSRIIYFNCPDWWPNPAEIDCHGMYCIDGLQRLTTLRMFLRDEVKLFDKYLSEYQDAKEVLRHATHCLQFNVNNLPKMRDMISWYLDTNTGGTPHTAQEIARVRKLLDGAK